MQNLNEVIKGLIAAAGPEREKNAHEVLYGLASMEAALDRVEREMRHRNQLLREASADFTKLMNVINKEPYKSFFVERMAKLFSASNDLERLLGDVSSET